MAIDGQHQVLEMLAQGTIDAEQAAELLDALDDRPSTPSSAPYSPASGDRGATRQHRRDASRRGTSPLRQLAEARLHGVNTEYVQAMHDAGLRNLPLEKLIEMKAVGVNPHFVAEMRNLGYTDLDPDELIELKVSGINPEFVREMERLGYLGPSVQAEPGTETDAETTSSSGEGDEALR